MKEMGHPQPETPMQTDNTTALGVVNNNIQPRRTKAMDMRVHWLRDREAKKAVSFLLETRYEQFCRLLDGTP